MALYLQTTDIGPTWNGKAWESRRSCANKSSWPGERLRMVLVGTPDALERIQLQNITKPSFWMVYHGFPVFSG
jgi:hypothetical protein